jgi:dTDP-4-dehydrorhamnose 3,5-epimerase
VGVKFVTNTSYNISGIVLTSLKVIDVPGGNVLHGMKCSDQGYSGFGEAYFSAIEPGKVKAWKRHRRMTLNLIVPIGAVRFVIYDDRQNSTSYGKHQEVTLSRLNNYIRLTVPPMVWVGFQGVSEHRSLLLNIIDIEHLPEEADRKEMNGIKYDWGLPT